MSSSGDSDIEKSYDERVDELLSSIQGNLAASARTKENKVEALDTAEVSGVVEEPKDPEMGIELQAFIDVIMD